MRTLIIFSHRLEGYCTLRGALTLVRVPQGFVHMWYQMQRIESLNRRRGESLCSLGPNTKSLVRVTVSWGKERVDIGQLSVR